MANTYIVTKDAKTGSWKLSVEHSDETEIGIGSYPSRAAAFLAGRLLAGRSGSCIIRKAA